MHTASHKLGKLRKFEKRMIFQIIYQKLFIVCIFTITIYFFSEFRAGVET